MKLSHALVVAGGLLVAASGAFAADSGPTIGERLASGAMTEQQLNQLLPFTGLTADEARALTLDEVVKLRWQND